MLDQGFGEPIPPTIIPPGGFIVPFVFDQAFPLMFRFTAEGLSLGDTENTLGRVALMPASFGVLGGFVLFTAAMGRRRLPSSA